VGNDEIAVGLGARVVSGNVTASVLRHDGSETTVEGRVGDSLMEILRDGGVHEVLALCGGCCSCATCHVYVDRQWLDQLAPASDEEQMLLSASSHLAENSRLACQIHLQPSLDGIRVAIAPED
jgi:2Fe-2S ferredoxin